jgi:hypothetical protein
VPFDKNATPEGLALEDIDRPCRVTAREPRRLEAPEKVKCENDDTARLG